VGQLHAIEISPTLATAVLLLLAFLGGKVAQLFRLPSLTGQLIVGALLGPAALGLLSRELAGQGLQPITDLALMILAFTIGEKLEISVLRDGTRRILAILFGEALGAFVLAGLGTAGAAILLGTFASPGIAVAMGLVLGAIAIAGSPGATLVVTKELEDPGPLGRLVLALAAANDALAIMVFGLCLAIANATLGGQVSPLDILLVPLLKTVGAVALGLFGGLLIDVVGGRFHNRSDVLIFGLAIIVGCGAAASALAVSPLLAGMAAGFAVVNRERRDTRIFRTLGDFAAPIYVLFFALAGSHVEIAAFAAGGAIGVAYIAGRFGGKIMGAAAAAPIGGMTLREGVRAGICLLPQAGVAVGFLVEMERQGALQEISAVAHPIALAGIVVAEVIGPAAARKVLAGEGCDRG